MPKKKHFVDSVVGLCSVNVVGGRNSWDVKLTVVYSNGKEEVVTEGAVRSYREHFGGSTVWPGAGEKISALPMFNRDAARRERDRVLEHMNNGLPIYIQTENGVEAICRGL
ncbi:MAG TPA: hypothetical protein VOA64_14635 [Candidatus Dormibacteraeota bacterium]|nr:hypothetical protein [Candidatus Dormibacteraeota bacterium]